MRPSLLRVVVLAALLLPFGFAFGASHSLLVKADGAFVLDGKTVGREQLRAAVAADPAGAWAVASDGGAATDLYWAESVIRRAGGTINSAGSVTAAEPERVGAVDTTAEDAEDAEESLGRGGAAEPAARTGGLEPVEAVPPVPKRSGFVLEGSQPIDGPAPSAVGVPEAPRVFHFQAEVGADLLFDLEHEGDSSPGLSFRLPRALFGGEANFSEVASTGLRLSAVPFVDRSVPDGRSRELDPGEAALFHDAWIDIHSAGETGGSIRLGVQDPVFGLADHFSSVADGDYLPFAVRSQAVAELAGLSPHRELGLSATAQGKDLGLTVLLSNGQAGPVLDTGTFPLAASARLLYGGKLKLVASGEYAPQPLDRAATVAVSAAVEWEGGRGRLIGEYLGGNAVPGFGPVIQYGAAGATNEAVAFIGGQAAGDLRLPLPASSLEDLIIVGRWGYFDPQAETTDADAWMLLDLGLGLTLPLAKDQTVMPGLAYEMEIPMDATLPIEHRASLGTTWSF